VAGGSHQAFDFTETFLASFASRDVSPADRRLFRKALRLLDTDERHPSPRIHQLRGDRERFWSVSASKELRMTFERMPGGGFRMLTCSRHSDHAPARSCLAGSRASRA
jgi:hypothetical protein